MNKDENKKNQDKVLTKEELEHICGGFIVDSESKRTDGYRVPDMPASDNSRSFRR